MMKNVSKSRLAVSVFFFLNGALLSSWIPHIPIVQERLGLSDGVLGIALFSIACGAMITMSTAGLIIQRFGSKRVTFFAAIGFCLAVPLPVVAPSFLTLVISLLIFGGFNGVMDVAMNAQAVIVEKRYGRPIMSSFHGLFSVGGLLGSSIGGLALSKGIPPFAHVIVVCVILFPFIIIFLRNLLEDEDEATVGEKAKIALNGRLICLGVLAFFVLMAEGSVADWSGVYIKQTLQNGPGFVAAGYASFSLTMAIGRLFGDRFVANIGPVVITRITAILAAAGLAAVLIWPSSVTVILGFGCVGLGLSNLTPVLFSSAGSIPGISAGKAIATVATAGYLGFLAGPPIIGGLAEIITLKHSLYLVVIFIFVVAIFAKITKKQSADSE